MVDELKAIPIPIPKIKTPAKIAMEVIIKYRVLESRGFISSSISSFIVISTSHCLIVQLDAFWVGVVSILGGFGEREKGKNPYISRFYTFPPSPFPLSLAVWEWFQLFPLLKYDDS